MNKVVRRRDTEIVGVGGKPSRPTVSVDDGLSVTSQLSLGVAPRLSLSWAVDDHYWSCGYRLLVFHNMSGFATERETSDFSQHGRLIIDTTTDGSRDEHLSEGTHFYTFLLQKEYFGLARSFSLVRVSETVTTAKIGISRIRDKMELDDLQRRHQLGRIEHGANVSDAKVRRIRSREALKKARAVHDSVGGTKHVVTEELMDTDAIVAILAARNKKIADLNQDELFISLNRKQRKMVLADLELRLEPGRVRARRDNRES